jgi:hypothetical protein
MQNREYFYNTVFIYVSHKQMNQFHILFNLQKKEKNSKKNIFGKIKLKREEFKNNFKKIMSKQKIIFTISLYLYY